MSYLQDFPVCFAEANLQEPTSFYVEWLDNNEEFPSLATDWEILKRKELTDPIQVIPVEEDWSTLDQQPKPYAKIAEHAADLQPLQRTLKPLWSHKAKTPRKIEESSEEDSESDYLAEDLIISQKGRSRRAARHSKKKHLRELKVVDVCISGFLQIATTKDGKKETSWHPRPIENDSESILTILNINNKSQALHFLAGYKDTLNKAIDKRGLDGFSSPRDSGDFGEYTVQAPIVKKL